MTWPSFLAAAIRAGVTGSGGGASASTRVENAVPASRLPAALSAPRREIFGIFIAPLYRRVLARFGIPGARFYSCSEVDSSFPMPLHLTVRPERWIWPATGPGRERDLERKRDLENETLGLRRLK